MFPSDNDLDFEFTMESDANQISEDKPFHILMLGDWSGRSFRSETEQNPPTFKMIEIDRDNFDEVLSNFNIKIDLNFDHNERSAISLSILDFDDFHPDYIFERNSIFAELRDLRKRLSKSDTFERAASEVRSWFDDSKENVKQEDVQFNDVTKANHSSSDLLDSILSQPKQIISEPKETSKNDELSKLIGKIVKPFISKIDENEQERLVHAVDEAISDLIRRILHHPRFKELEASWRGLHFLVKSAETDTKLKIFISDINKNELASELKSTDVLMNSEYHKMLNYSGDLALICGSFSFEINVDDIALLIRLAKISHKLNAPFASYLNLQVPENEELSDLIETLLGADSIKSKLWNTFRDVPETDSVMLLTQRLLIRMPYGADTEPVEMFTFEENLHFLTKNDLLWINPCFVIALLLARNFSSYGWEMNHNLDLEIDQLPIHQDKNSGKLISNSEYFIGEKLFNQISQVGLLPIISNRNDENIRIPFFQPVSKANKRLSCKWNQAL